MNELYLELEGRKDYAATRAMQKARAARELEEDLAIHPPDAISGGGSTPDQPEEAGGGPLDFIYDATMDAVCANSYQCANRAVEDGGGATGRN